MGSRLVLLMFGLMLRVDAESVLIVLRQPEGPVGQRIAALPQATVVPDEIRAAVEHERTAMSHAQQKSIAARLAAAGATGVVPYPALNMVRAEIPAAAQSALRSDPAVMSVTPLSEGTPVPHLMNSGGGVAGMPPGMTMPGQMMPGQMMPGQMPGMPAPAMAGGGMWQSLFGVTGQVSAQTGMMMPRTAGMMVLLSGGAQIAQAIAASRKPNCTPVLDTTTAKAPAGGGAGLLVVQTSPGCLWQAVSNSEWLKVENEGPVVGSGIVRYTVAASEGRRSGVVTIAGIGKTTVRGRAQLKVAQGE